MVEYGFLPTPSSGLTKQEVEGAYRAKYGNQPRWILLHIALAMIFADQSIDYDVAMMSDCAYLLRKAFLYWLVRG